MAMHSFAEPLTGVPPENEDGLYEVVDGERRELEPMSALAVSLAAALLRYMANFVWEHKLGIAVPEMLFVLDAGHKLKRRPDVAFVSYAHWPDRTPPDTEAWNVVPDLAVEIVSPSNLAKEIDTKITDYFAAGVKLVWVVYPTSGRVYVHSSPKHVRVLGRDEELDGGDVLPGFRLPIAALYEALTKPD
jgi:Uma2 family endonuclease